MNAQSRVDPAMYHWLVAYCAPRKAGGRQDPMLKDFLWLLYVAQSVSLAQKASSQGLIMSILR